MYKIMTPGPTQVAENVRMARSITCTNPDLDEDFFDYYKETCELISELLHTENETLILNGEGILGLEAACATMTEKGDRVLILDNGIYGKGFSDFVAMYGGVPILYTVDYKNEIDVENLKMYLEEDHDFKYATVVHCDTPSGMLNDIQKICPLLNSYGIMTVVDSVSAMFGTEIRVDDSKIDILCGASQKAVSAPPGLTFVTVSEQAKRAMRNRKTPVQGFYVNLMIFDGYYEKKWFPYTMPISDIYGLHTAMENIKNDSDMVMRHRQIASAVRHAVTVCGLCMYPESGFSDTVTVVQIPDGAKAEQILKGMKEKYGIMLAGSFDILAGQVIRIGHMGENCRRALIRETLDALDHVLNENSVRLKGNLALEFEKYM